MLNSYITANFLLIVKKFKLCTTFCQANAPEAARQTRCDFCLDQQFEREKPFA